MTPTLEAAPAAAPRFFDRVDTSRLVMNGLIILVILWLVVVVVLPLFQLISKSLMDRDGAFVGLANYIHYFRTPALSNSLYNSLSVSLTATAVSVVLGFLYAYALTRTRLPGQEIFRGLAMAPLFAPTLLNGIGLVYLFGAKGLITRGFFGAVPGIDIGLYGQVGITISEVLFTFPQAVLIMSIALRMTDARLYEASDSLGASKARTFFTVTLPSVKYGLLSSVFVCFVLAFTDFGAPKVVGGNFNVLAVDIYKQVIGQQNFVMGAVVGVVLLIPPAAAFIGDRVIQRKQAAMFTGNSVPLVPGPDRARDWFFLAYCGLIAALIVAFFATAVFASLVKVWPYNLELGWWHYTFRGTGGGGYQSFFNSIRMSLYSAVVGTAATFLSAYLVEKSPGLPLLRQLAYFLSILPLALPGLVIGLSYIFFFNSPGWTIMGLEIPNPLNFIYGTMTILVFSNVVHFYTVSFLSAATALKQLDREFESAAESMGVPFWSTFSRVTVPVCLPAILEIGMYYFVNSMATVSAVIFLYSADIKPAAAAIANMDDAGDIAPACAMSVLVVLTNILARLLYGACTRGLRRRADAWLAR
ncbi:MAG: putative 2-aminoethylphosphonate ABC transporter permease subunit [Pseudomonadota bacterium]